MSDAVQSAAGAALRPGVRVRVEQRIEARDGGWATAVEGEVLSYGPERSGSWFAGGRNGVVWLNRLRLRKPDGEITALNVDQNTVVTILPAAS